MSHFLFPRADRKGKPASQYGNLAIPALIRMLRKLGSRMDHLETQIFGGGSRSLEDSNGIGRDNTKIARKILKKREIPLVSEDIGGVKGRPQTIHVHAFVLTNASVI